MLLAPGCHPSAYTLCSPPPPHGNVTRSPFQVAQQPVTRLNSVGLEVHTPVLGCVPGRLLEPESPSG